MARKTVVTCDVCGAIGTDIHKFKVTVAGGDGNWGGDMCESCIEKMHTQFPGSPGGATGYRKPRRETFGEVLDLDSTP